MTNSTASAKISIKKCFQNFLSDAAAREEYLAALTGWLVARLGRGPARA